MINRTTQVAGAAIFVALVGIPFAVAQTDTKTPSTQDSRPLTFLKSSSSVTVDDHYLYVLGDGQIQRIDKTTGMSGGQLTATGWSAPAGGTGTAGGTTGGASSTPAAGH